MKNLAKSPAIQACDAEAVAIDALGFLAGDPERLSRFLDLTGLDPSSLRVAASAPGFLAGVLEYVASDESLMIVFAANAGCDPADVAAASAILSSRARSETSP